MPDVFTVFLIKMMMMMMMMNLTFGTFMERQMYSILSLQG